MTEQDRLEQLRAQIEQLEREIAEAKAAAGRDPNTGRFLPGHDHINPERRARGERHWAHMHPERVAADSAKGHALHPESYRGERNGRYTKPERTARGERQGLAKLTDEKVREIRRRYACGESATSLAWQYGVTRNAITSAATRLTWKHVE